MLARVVRGSAPSKSPPSQRSSQKGGPRARPKFCYGKYRIQIVADHARASRRRRNSKLLVMRHHARRSLLQLLRKSAAAKARRLLHVFRISAKTQCGYGRTRKGILRVKPSSSSRRLRSSRRTRAQLEPRTKFHAQQIGRASCRERV